MKLCCTNQNCEFFGEELVDLGWGDPRCKSNYAKLYPVPLKSRYRGYKKYFKVVHNKVLK